MDKYNNNSYKEKYPFNVDFLKKAYIEEGRTLKQMCEVMGVASPITVSKILNAYGISTNNNNRVAEQTQNGMNDESFKQYLFKEYISKRRSLSSIADELGVTAAVVRKRLEKYNIPRRSRNEKSSCFSGGRRLCSNGYIEIVVPGHPATNARGYVYEHRVVAEKKLGRYLLPGEVVHHINGKKTDNVPENLIVLLNSEHIKLHALLDKGIPYSEAIKEVNLC